jgi:hypothetical protein
MGDSEVGVIGDGHIIRAALIRVSRPILIMTGRRAVPVATPERSDLVSTREGGKPIRTIERHFKLDCSGTVQSDLDEREIALVVEAIPKS